MAMGTNQQRNSAAAVPISASDIWKKQIQEYGWVVLNVPVSFWSSLQYKESEAHQEWLLQPTAWRELHGSLFDPPPSITSRTTARYVGNESGGNGLEPKQSWEFGRAAKLTERVTKDSSDSPPLQQQHLVDRRLGAVLDLLHAVGDHVNTICCSASLSKLLVCGDGKEEPLDLLRAFRYEPTGESATSSTTLGSNPHTDWGSWTVVWQDTVGGLQTFQDGAWYDVPADVSVTSSKEPELQFVVHVGDVTSLVAGYPSPLHRVTSPRFQHRHSLVYFMYPAPDMTLRGLMCCEGSQKKEVLVDNDNAYYQHYSLLQDQSHEVEERKAAREVLTEILDTQLGEVFRRKWAQVQR